MMRRRRKIMTTMINRFESEGLEEFLLGNRLK
jgi:hypothetical protein